MFPKERRKKIVQIVNADGSATVEDLAARFSVSVDSIRKDLKALANQGLLRREYGGAVRVEAPKEPAVPEPEAVRSLTSAEGPQVPVGLRDLRDDIDDASRRSVAARAFMEIGDNDAIFLDVSKTSYYIAELLAQSDKRVIVTTNMVDIPRVLAANPRVTALMTGGYLSPDLRGFTGPSAVSLLEPLMFEKVFVSASAITLQNKAVMTDIMDDGLVKQRVIQNATYRFLLAERGKFGRRSGYRFASVGDFTGLVTDLTDPVQLRAIASLGVATLC